MSRAPTLSLRRSRTHPETLCTRGTGGVPALPDTRLQPRFPAPPLIRQPDPSVILSLFLPLQKAGKKDNALFLSPLAGFGKPGDARRGRGKEVTSALSTWLQFQSHTASGKSTLKREREKKRVFVEVGGGHSKGGKEGPAADHWTGTLTIGSGHCDDFHL